MADDRLIIFDTTLRDGEQSPGASMNLSEKLEVAHALKDLGVDVIEAGFPIASPGDFEAVQAIARQIHGPIICGLARCSADDIDRAWAALREARGRASTSSSPPAPSTASSSSRWPRKRSSTAPSRPSSAPAPSATTWSFRRKTPPAPNSTSSPRSSSASSRSAPPPSTSPTPSATPCPASTPPPSPISKSMFAASTTIVLSVHCHNDLGLAVANSLAAVQEGARQIECTINGIGERAGNCSLEEIVMAIRTRKDYFNLTTGINTRRLYPTSRLVSHVTGIQVQRNKAIVGQNAFAHEAGIHQDGMLKERSTYEIMNPEDVGLPQHGAGAGQAQRPGRPAAARAGPRLPPRRPAAPEGLRGVQGVGGP